MNEIEKANQFQVRVYGGQKNCLPDFASQPLLHKNTSDDRSFRTITGIIGLIPAAILREICSGDRSEVKCVRAAAGLGVVIDAHAVRRLSLPALILANLGRNHF